jgi:hypothetical protein
MKLSAREETGLDIDSGQPTLFGQICVDDYGQPPSASSILSRKSHTLASNGSSHNISRDEMKK